LKIKILVWLAQKLHLFTQLNSPAAASNLPVGLGPLHEQWKAEVTPGQVARHYAEEHEAIPLR
jgi:hypothetical protein